MPDLGPQLLIWPLICFAFEIPLNRCRSPLVPDRLLTRADEIDYSLFEPVPFIGVRAHTRGQKRIVGFMRRARGRAFPAPSL